MNFLITFTSAFTAISASVSASDYLRTIEKAIALVTFLQTLELLAMRNILSEAGVWKWSTLQKYFPAPLGRLLSPLLGDRGFPLVLGCRLAFSILLFCKGIWVFSFLLTLATLLISLRFLGTFNGGSDSMTFLILYSVSFARFFDTRHSLVKGALLYVGVQIIFSYLIAGWAKLKNAQWRSGQALIDFVTRSHYETPEKMRKLATGRQNRRIFRALSWGLIIFECALPLIALLSPALCALFIAVGALFHLGAFYLFGLNRFFFAWLAGYPAVFYLACCFHRG